MKRTAAPQKRREEQRSCTSVPENEKGRNIVAPLGQFSMSTNFANVASFVFNAQYRKDYAWITQWYHTECARRQCSDTYLACYTMCRQCTFCAVPLNYFFFLFQKNIFMLFIQFSLIILLFTNIYIFVKKIIV